MSWKERIRRVVLGPPKDLRAHDALHSISLAALLAWVGLGADGLSSSAYGPDEAFRHLGEHRGIAVFVAMAMAITVAIISWSYSRIIEAFPSGGGGYVVASKLLGPRVGVVSGAALLVDYVLTITVSIAAGADAIFSFIPGDYHAWKLLGTMAALGLLTLMNLRGIKESVTAITPVFGLFLVTHAVLLVSALAGHVVDVGATAANVRADISGSLAALGTFGVLRLFLHAYSFGGGTYTGIEAVSNGVSIMQEPRVRTAQRTMLLMAVSLALTAAGLMLAYLLVGVSPVEGQTMNATLLDRVAGSWSIFGVRIGPAFVIAALVSEAALLVVAAQAGFIDGPRVMANLAVDSGLPHRFSALSERLTMRNGVMLMAGSSAAALVYTGGNVSALVVMYAINVFVTFLLSTGAMFIHEVRSLGQRPNGFVRVLPHGLAAALCGLILVVTLVEKFTEGGWLTAVITAAVVALCFAIRRHYRRVEDALRHLEARVPGEVPAPVANLTSELPLSDELGDVDFETGEMQGVREHHARREPDPRRPVAVLFVGGYSGLGRLSLLTLERMFPGHFHGVVFVRVAVVDSEAFKGSDQVGALLEHAEADLLRYESFAWSRGFAAASAVAMGTEVTAEAERIAVELSRRFPKALFVGGQLVFEEDTWWNRILHNETAFLVQARLQHRGLPMIVVPTRVDLARGNVIPLPGTVLA